MSAENTDPNRQASIDLAVILAGHPQRLQLPLQRLVDVAAEHSAAELYAAEKTLRTAMQGLRELGYPLPAQMVDQLRHFTFCAAEVAQVREQEVQHG